jgi:hypothetical protein
VVRTVPSSCEATLPLAHIPHGRLVHFLDLSADPGNKAAATDERHLCRWEPMMLNRIQQVKLESTKLVSLRRRQLVD